VHSQGLSLRDGSTVSQSRGTSLHHHPSATDDEFDYPEGGFRAYLVVFGAFSGMFSAFGFMNTIGTLQAYISTHQLSNYNESAVGWIFSLYIFLAFFGGIQVGPAFDRWGPRELVAAGSVLLVTGELGLANSTSFGHFIINLSILCGLGTTLIFTPCISAIAHWFCRRRATMTGFAATGGSVGGVLFPMLLPSLFESIGWAWAMRLMALVNIVACCISLVLLKGRLPPKRGTSVLPDFTIFRNLAFTFTTGGVFAMEWGLFVPLTFLSSWALDAGLGSAPHSSTFPFQILAILNGSSFFGRWLPGIAADRWGRFNTLAASMAGSLVFLVAVWLPAILLPGGGDGEIAAEDGILPYDGVRTGLAILFSVGFGFFFGAGISLTPVCVGELCDPREYGRWYATCYSVVSFGCLTGVPIAGVVLGDGGTKGWVSLVAWTSACYAMSLACFVAARVAKGGWRVLSAV
jgi:MFS family permease